MIRDLLPRVMLRIICNIPQYPGKRGLQLGRSRRHRTQVQLILLDATTISQRLFQPFVGIRASSERTE